MKEARVGPSKDLSDKSPVSDDTHLEPVYRLTISLRDLSGAGGAETTIFEGRFDDYLRSGLQIEAPRQAIVPRINGHLVAWGSEDSFRAILGAWSRPDVQAILKEGRDPASVFRLVRSYILRRRGLSKSNAAVHGDSRAVSKPRFQRGRDALMIRQS